MKRRNKISSILTLFISVAMVFQGPAMAQVEISIPIDIVVKITTHPDEYNTQLPLQMNPPVVADLNCDDVLDIIGAGYNPNTKKSSVFVWHRSGVVQPGWPKEVDGKIENVPAVGDLDGNGDLEIVVSVSKNPPDVDGWVYVWHHDGSSYNGYPMELDYKPGAPLVGDVTEGFEEESIVYESNMSMAICDIDLDGKKEVIIASPFGIDVLNEDDIPMEGWPVPLLTIGNVVAGDVDGNGKPEVFLAVKTPDANYIYGWHNDGSAIEGWPVNIAGVVNAPGDYLSLADIDNDEVAEILTGSNNGYIAGWHLNGQVAFSDKPTDSSIYQPIVGDIDNDGDMEILATSKSGNIYCYDQNGNPAGAGWPYNVNYELSPGAVLVDIDMDSEGDEVNPANDLELLFSASDGMVHSIDLPGDFHPNDIQWGMYGYNSRNTSNYLRDWDTSGWFVFDNEPDGATIQSVYDWNRGSRVIELKGAGLNNCYVFKQANGKPFNSKNSCLQWSMRYGLPFNIYVSVDTIKGKRFLYYNATDGNQLKDGIYIHHGLGGNAKNARWHTFSRQLVQDLKDAEQDNEIVDINAIYIQGSGRIDDVMLLKGLSCVDIVNLAFDADVEVSSGDATKDNINDGDSDTKWVSDDEDISWVEYTWKNPQKVNKIVIEAVDGAKSGVIFITDSEGNVYEIEFEVPEDGSPIEIVFDSIDDVKTIVVVFDNEDGPVSVGEIGVYYDPNVEEEEGPQEEEYSAEDYIKIKGGYFFDPIINAPWIPHGISYQTWNKALGQWQSPAELKNDLDMMKEVGANALRVDFVWKHIEVEDGVFDWSRCDMLLEEAQARGMKAFPIIGYQWPPDWFPDEWHTMHPQNEKHPDGPWLSDILSYEDPEVLNQFGDFLKAVVKRYSVGGVREDLGDTVAGWILGNEYGYLGLWSIEYDGYDEDCQNAFREWLEAKYNGDIGALNAKWAQDNIKTPGYLPGYPYNNFSEVDMPIPFGYQGETKGKYLARDKASWYDLTQWREESIGKFVALAAKAVREVDPYHLITYAAVGMQWGEEDWRYHTEDARKIAKTCVDMGYPLDFWSINNYPWGLENSELMTGQWGIERARHDTGLPVIITETGFTDTETMYPGITTQRQAKLTRNAIWEALETGAIGVCVFHWNDRAHPWLTPREKGFGIVTEDKEPKPAYFSVKQAFEKMDSVNIAQFLVGSIDPLRDIAFLWDDAVDTIINRYQAEMKELYGTLERLGYEPTFINDQELLDNIYLDYDAIVLPRNQKMFDQTFDILWQIKADGVKIHADADVPGIMNEYGEPRDKIEWLLAMKDLFGIDATNCQIDPDLEDNIYYDGYEVSSFWPINWCYKPKRVVYPEIGFDKTLNMWKYRDKILPDGGIVKAVFDNPDENPALVFHFDTAISLFSLGDCKPINNAPYSDWTWSDRYDWVKTIYEDWFNIQPELYVSNKYVLVDYRKCADGSVLLSFKNYRPDTEETTDVTTALIVGKTVKGLLSDPPEIIEENSDGTIQRTLPPDGHDLLLAYSSVPLEKDFNLIVNPLSQTIKQGESTSYAIILEPINGFSAPVDVNVSNIPPGANPTLIENQPGDLTLLIDTEKTILPDTYQLNIVANGGGKTHSVTVSLIVNPLMPDFKVFVTPNTIEVNAGDPPISYTVELTSIDGFDSSVNLSVKTLLGSEEVTEGINTTFDAYNIIPPATTGLNVSTTPELSPNTYKLVVKGKAEGKTRQKTVYLNVKPPLPQPDFGLTITPDSQKIKQTETANYIVGLTPINGFNSSVSLTVKGLPGGANGVFTPESITPQNNATLKVETEESVVPGIYNLTIEGTCDGKTKSVSVKLEIEEKTEPQIPDFELAVTPQIQKIKQGETANYTVGLTPINGFNSSVSLTVKGLPGGANGVFTPESITPQNNATLKVEIGDSVIPGVYNLTIEGTCDGKTKSVSVKLEIEEKTEPQQIPDFGLTVTPDLQTIKQGESTSYTAKLTSIDNFNSPVTLKVTGLPDGANWAFAINSFIPPGNTTLNISTTESVATGTYNLKIEGTSGDLTHSGSVKLTINNKEDGQQDSSQQQTQTQVDTASSSTYSSSTTGQTGTSSTSSSEDTDGSSEDTEDSSGIKPAPGSIIILEKGKKKEGGSYSKAEEIKPKGSLNLGARTYVGSAYHATSSGGSGESVPTYPEPTPIPELPPIEQFQRAIEEAMDKEMGVIRVKPEIVPPARLEEIIKRPKTEPEKPAINLDIAKIIDMWVSAFRNWWQDLVKRFQFAFNKSSRYYA